MTRWQQTSSSPQPKQPAAAAQTLAEAAQAAARAWLQPLDPAQHSLAISHLYSTLRDIGIAALAAAIQEPADDAAGDSTGPLRRPGCPRPAAAKKESTR